MMRKTAPLAALCVLAGCSLFESTAPMPPPDFTQRPGADRQAPATGLTTNRSKARHDADDPAVDESRGQPVGSIVPRNQPSPKQPPAAAPSQPPSATPM